MDILDLRLLFTVGLLALGGLALLIGFGVTRMLEGARLHRAAQTSRARHRAVTDHAYGGRRS